MVRQDVATEFPLHLCEVLEEEIVALLPDAARAAAEPETVFPWDFTPEQIRREGLSDLLARLQEPGDEVCRRLRKRLSSGFRTLLEQQSGEGGPSTEALRGPLAGELTRLLREDDLAAELAHAARADRVRLSEEMEVLLADPPADSRRLLRLLLEEIFPDVVEARCEARLQAVYRRIHAHPRGLAALCLSGGGIRSAVFGLGVVQGLARRRLLHGFDYLSTVSGGGYLGGLLSAWIHRHPRGLDGVSCELAGPAGGACKLQPEPAPLEHLRSFSNYLSPKLGVLSADSWTLASIFVRNLCLYWFVLIPLLLAVLALPRLFVALSMMRPEPWFFLGNPPWYPKPAYLIPDGLFAFAGPLMATALAYMAWNRPSGGRRSTLRGFLLVCLLPLTVGLALLNIWWAWYPDEYRETTSWIWFALIPVLMNVGAWSVNALPALARGRVRPLAILREMPLMAASSTLGGFIFLLEAKVLFLQPAKGVPGAETWQSYVAPWYGAFSTPLFLVAWVFGQTVFTGLVSRWTDDDDREWWSRSTAWMLIVAVGWATVAAVVIFGPVLLAYWRWILAPVGGLAGLATGLLARSSLTAQSKGKDQASPLAMVLDVALALAAPVFLLVLTAALSLGLSWLLGLPLGRKAPPPAKGDDALALWHIRVVVETPVFEVLAFVVLALGFGLVMALFIDVNKFSLHAMYRNRLIRTFLGASRKDRRPNAFTGFDGEDNVEIWRLRRPLFLRRENLEAHGVSLCLRLQDGSQPLSAAIVSRHLAEETRRLLQEYADPAPPSVALLDALVEDFNRMIRGRFDEPLLSGLALTGEQREQLRRARSDDERHLLQRDLLLRAFQEEIDTARPPRPLHVINVALNLVAGKKLAWQQRKAEPFTFSPLHCGSARLGYRAAELYARGARNRAISLGTAMAISGAAASPNMGYHSSPAITFLMTFFNARLGWWLGNPGAAGARTFGHGQPRLAVGPLISEALGLTDDRDPYVYLSDGGHFENLGLYEMVLRRCRHIMVVDAGQDHECRFEDLGNALRKIRVDLGIRIHLAKVPIWAEVPAGETGRYCAVGKILYSEVDGPQGMDGLLLYLKPAVYGGEPQDIQHYKALNKVFPHESTGDQWFSEQQFESYRALGLHAVDAICAAAGEAEIADLPGLFRVARLYLGEVVEEALPVELRAAPLAKRPEAAA